MPEIVVLSGKGGTGKTSLTAAFAHLMHNGIVCDLDVDAPDLHILLAPQVQQEHAFISGVEARIAREHCTYCGRCEVMCRFEAIHQQGNNLAVNPLRCEGCGVCHVVCPSNAISLTQKHCGQWYESSSRFGPMVHAQLFPGEENSGRLVSVLKQQARETAKKNALDLILCDGSPGIGCPVISSLSGAHLAVLVVEPTPSGQHDFLRVADLCDHFHIPASIIINKADLNLAIAAAIENLCTERGYAVAGKLPFNMDITTAMIAKQAITETASPLGAMVVDAWENILIQLKNGARKRTLPL
ncbi:ATP-binding protein [Desulfovibrio cuneatus]|uniref:ATP-binding protein n=1 Tax=Desulfovibrio cuneatus TaxID=159728 RepID=UPI0004213E94|nr:ATP-binding protein [Desulfovibrio cuneatus]